MSETRTCATRHPNLPLIPADANGVWKELDDVH